MRTFTIILCISGIATAAGWIVNHSLVKLNFGFGKILEDLIVCAGTFIPFGAIVLLLYEMTGVQRIKETFRIFKR